MRISISVSVTRVWSPPSWPTTATISTSPRPSDTTGHHSRAKRINRPSFMYATSYALCQSFSRNQAGGPEEQHHDDDGEDEGVAERPQILRQVGLQHHRYESDGEAADHRADQAAHAADHRRNEGKQHQRHVHHVAERAGLRHE